MPKANNIFAASTDKEEQMAPSSEKAVNCLAGGCQQVGTTSDISCAICLTHACTICRVLVLVNECIGNAGVVLQLLRMNRRSGRYPIAKEELSGDCLEPKTRKEQATVSLAGLYVHVETAGSC